MIDWTKPLFAKGKDRQFPVKIDAAFFHKDDYMPIKFPLCIWTDRGSNPGTWYFNNLGESVAGRSPTGYEARYYLTN